MNEALDFKVFEKEAEELKKAPVISTMSVIRRAANDEKETAKEIDWTL